MSKSICTPNFDISFHSWVITTSESINGSLPYWNSTYSFNFDLFVVLNMAFCMGLPNLIKIGQRTAELWCHINFSRWWPWSRKSTSGFGFSYGTRLAISTSICTQNFGEISQSAADLLLLLPVCKMDVRTYWDSTSDLDFDLFLVMGIALYYVSACQIWSKSAEFQG